MQCKDIPDEPILRFIENHKGDWCFLYGDLRCVVNAMPSGIPEKLILAKMRMLMRRGLIAGCDCGCRGDFTLTKKGQSFLSRLNAEIGKEPEV